MIPKKKFQRWGIRKKIFFAVLMGVIFSVGITTWVNYLGVSSRLTDSTAERIGLIGEKTKLLVQEQVDNEVDLLNSIAFSFTVKQAVLDANRSAAGLSAEGIYAKSKDLDSAWLTGDTSADAFIHQILTNSTSEYLQGLQTVYEEDLEIIVTDQFGRNIALTDRTTDYWQADEEWWQIARSGQVYYTSPTFDESSQHWAMIVAVPMIDDKEQRIIGVVRGTLNINSMLASIFDIQFGKTGIGAFISNDGKIYRLVDGVIKVEDVPEKMKAVLAREQDTLEEDLPDMNGQISIVSFHRLGDADHFIGWIAVMMQQSELDQLVFSTLREDIILALVLVLILGSLSVTLSNDILKGLNGLEKEANLLAAGDYTQSFSEKIEHSKDPDIASLVESFNFMRKEVQTRERALATSERKHRQLVETMNEGLAMLDTHGIIQYVNPGLCDLLGYSAEELLNRSLFDVFPATEHEKVRTHWNSRLEGYLTPYETTLITHSGDLLPAAISPQLILEEDDRFSGVLAVVTDISARKKNETVMQKKISELAGLREIDIAILEDTSLEKVVHAIFRQFRELLKIQAAALTIFSPGTSEIDISKYFILGREGYSAEDDLDKEKIRLYGEQKKAQIIHTEIDAHLCCAELKKYEFQTLYIVPILANDQMKGLLEIAFYESFSPSEEWISYFDALLAQAVMGIEKIELLGSLQVRNLELQEAYNSAIQGWAKALELRDKETKGHSDRVVHYSIELAQHFGISGIALNHFRIGALLHDIGKMGVPDSILLKPGALDDHEWEMMRKHPEFAYQLLSDIPFLKDAVEIPYYHHERWDGSGYPFGLKGESIPLAARIFAVVDVWDALTSDRPYRPAWTHERVKQYLLENGSVQFDPVIVERFLMMLEQENPG